MAPRFQTDAEFLHYLQAINPECEYAPADFDWQAANAEVKKLVMRFSLEFNCQAGFDGGMSIQDATFFADIYLPGGILRFSNYQRLVTLCTDTPPPADWLARVVAILEQEGYTFVPFRFFGESFSSLQRGDDGLFTQLFDYV